jgi:hypothetical protein
VLATPLTSGGRDSVTSAIRTPSRSLTDASDPGSPPWHGGEQPMTYAS